MGGDHSLQKFFSIVFGFLCQALFQFFAVQMDHCEIGFRREAENLLRQSMKLLHLLEKKNCENIQAVTTKLSKATVTFQTALRTCLSPLCTLQKNAPHP